MMTRYIGILVLFVAMFGGCTNRTEWSEFEINEIIGYVQHPGLMSELSSEEIRTSSFNNMSDDDAGACRQTSGRKTQLVSGVINDGDLGLLICHLYHCAEYQGRMPMFPFPIIL